MTFDVWYDLGYEASLEAWASRKSDFMQWRIHTPLPRTHAEVANAVKKILDEHGPILITIAKSRSEKPQHD